MNDAPIAEWQPLSNSELNWLAWGTILGILRQARSGSEIIIEPQGPFGAYFMRKAGLRLLPPSGEDHPNEA